jgi:acyl carrier protein
MKIAGQAWLLPAQSARPDLHGRGLRRRRTVVDKADDVHSPRLAEFLREDGMIRDAEVMIDSESGLISAFIVPHGLRSAPELRQRAMRIAGDAAGRLQIVLVQDIPRTPDGSLDEAQGRMAMQRSGTVHRYEPAATEIERSVVALVEEVLPRRQVSVTDSFAGLGGDSLSTLQLTALIEERLGVYIPPQDAFGAESLRDLAAAVDSMSRSSQEAGNGSY